MNKKWWKRKWKKAKVFLLGKAKYMPLLIYAWGCYHYGSINFADGTIKEISDKIKFIGYSATIGSIILVYIQFRANHDWSRRQQAMTALWEVRGQLDRCLYKLNKAFKYKQRKLKYVCKVDDIHDVICLKDKDGKLVEGEDRRYLIDYEGNGHNVKRAIYSVLNTYEYLAAGVHQKVLDKEIIHSIYNGRIIKASYFFEEYIYHMNWEMNPEMKGSIWCNFVALANEFREREGSQVVDIEERDPAG